MVLEGSLAAPILVRQCPPLDRPLPYDRKDPIFYEKHWSKIETSKLELENLTCGSDSVVTYDLHVQMSQVNISS